MKFNNSKDFKFKPNTPIEFYVKEITYISGQGNSEKWVKVKSDGFEVFYCQWQTTYGDRALTAESLGIKESATIKTFYNPKVIEKITKSQTLIVKNLDNNAFENGKPNSKCSNLFELWGGVDNVLQENKFIEFRARRFESL